MKRVIEIALQECANLSIAEARQITRDLGVLIKCDNSIKAAVLKFKFQFKQSWKIQKLN